MQFLILEELQWKKVENVRIKKRERKGAFKKKIFLKTVEED